VIKRTSKGIFSHLLPRLSPTLPYEQATWPKAPFHAVIARLQWCTHQTKESGQKAPKSHLTAYAIKAN
jgi:hypothetical protein